MFIKNKFINNKQIKNLEKELKGKKTEELSLYGKLGSKLHLVKKIRLIEADSKEEAEEEYNNIVSDFSNKRNRRELGYITNIERIEIYSKSNKNMVGIIYSQYDLKPDEDLEEYEYVEKRMKTVLKEINELKAKLSELTKEK